jgi:hypothetical protein
LGCRATCHIILRSFVEEILFVSSISSEACVKQGHTAVKLTLFSCCALVILTAISGCAGTRPLLWPPGPIRQQQYNASLHDPYTDNDAGPEVVGGRPRDFQKPLAEPVRSRWLRDSWWSR